MSGIEPLAQAIITGTKETFSTLEMGLEHAPPKSVPNGSISGQVTSLLTYRNELSGSFCFKSTIEFGSVLCQKMVGIPGLENDYEMLKDAVAEMLNWISGAIKRNYEHGKKIIISTPMVYTIEEDIETDVSEEEVLCLRFFYEEHEFTIEITVDE